MPFGSASRHRPIQFPKTCKSSSTERHTVLPMQWTAHIVSALHYSLTEHFVCSHIFGVRSKYAHSLSNTYVPESNENEPGKRLGFISSLSSTPESTVAKKELPLCSALKIPTSPHPIHCNFYFLVILKINSNFLLRAPNGWSV